MITKQALLRSLDAGLRADGRKLLEIRPITIEYDVSRSAEGSAKVRCGSTELIAGVKMSVEEPYSDTPDKGNLMVNAELTPLASPKFEVGQPTEWAIELARVTDRGIRESHSLKPESLCIEAGKAVWSVLVDIVAINDNGNLLDMAGFSSMAALMHTRYPGVKGGKADYEVRTETKLKLECLPIPVTVWVIGKNFIVDPLPDEESLADARLTVTSLEDGTIVALQKGGVMPLTPEQMDRMVGIAMDTAKELRAKLG